MYKTFLLFLTGIFVFCCFSASEGQEKIFLVAKDFIPVFNSADMDRVFGGESGQTLGFDSSGLVRELEFVAFPGSVFIVQEEVLRGGRKMYRVITDEYPYTRPAGLFVDPGFSHEISREKPPAREKRLPSFTYIINNLMKARGTDYVWGGNVSGGIPEMFSIYPYKGLMSPRMKAKWSLKGVDCSGLLYEATNGWTPRNTSSLVNYGRPVNIEGHGLSDILSVLKPLDLIVWDGHVVVVLDNEKAIESRAEYENSGIGRKSGVKERPLARVLQQIIKERTPVDRYHDPDHGQRKRFVVRRWYE